MRSVGIDLKKHLKSGLLRFEAGHHDRHLVPGRVAEKLDQVAGRVHHRHLAAGAEAWVDRQHDLLGDGGLEQQAAQVAGEDLHRVPLGHRPDAKRAAIIGVGSGMSTSVMLTSPTIERVDTIEIEPSMVEGAKLFRPFVDAAFDDPRSHIVIDDAKEAGKPKPTGTVKGLGTALRAALGKGTPGLDKLIEEVSKTAEKRGWLKGIDGRKIKVRSKHSAFNFLL